MDLDKKEITCDTITDEISGNFKDVFFTSAKTGEGVSGAFHELAISVLLMMCRSDDEMVGNVDIMDVGTIKNFLGNIFTLLSQVDDFDPDVQAELFDKCEIDERYLDMHIKEEKAINFAREAYHWCENNENTDVADKIKSMIQRYVGNHRLGRY